jgi:membrane protease YdiL (CAAX protease family)
MTPEHDAAPVVPEQTTPLSPAKRPRVWTVFVAYLAALVSAVGLQVVAVIAVVAWLLTHGTGPEHLQTDLTSLLTMPAAFILLGLLGQGSIGLAALIPARLSPEPTLLRLRLVRPALPGWGYPAVAVASFLPLGVGVGLAEALAQVVPADESAAALYRQMTWEAAVPFVLFIALAPAFTEELLFRGYIQGRLLRRWPAWVAILVTAVLFALMHVTPHAVVAVLPLAFWLGVLAWRTGSVWPGIVCHAWVNGTWNVWQIGRRGAGLSEMPPVPVLVGLGVVVLASFVVSCWLLRRPGQAVLPTAKDKEFPSPA